MRFASSIILLFITIFSIYASVNDDGRTWIATDELGRTLPTAEQFPLKNDGKQRTVGIFYVTWHTENLHNGQPYTNDVTKILQANPMAAKGNPDFPYASYHWGEPEYGYFLSQDRYVISHDRPMLADAGVEVLILDVTIAVGW